MTTAVSSEFRAFERPRSGVFRLLSSTEESLLATLLGAMVLIPVAEIVLRRLGVTGISGSTAIVQHCTLVLSMFGAAIAARDGKLLSIGTGAFIPQRARPVASVMGTTTAAIVAAILCVASVRFVLLERGAAKILAFNVPVWAVTVVIPAGFAVIAVRLVRQTSPKWSVRTVAAAAVIAVVIVVTTFQEPTNAAIATGIGAVALAALIGAPIFAVIGGTALVGYAATGIPFAAMAVKHYSLVVNPSLPAIPLFTLAGYILADGGASRRLVRVFDALVGNVRGGPAAVTVLACAFFTTFTGGSGVTILALGGLLLPILVQAGYTERNALGLVTGAGALGILFPPCLPLILYAVAANVDVNDLFIAGIVPGILLVVLTILLGRFQQPRVEAGTRFDLRRAGSALWGAKWDLLLPVVALGALFGGLATPVEAAALTAFYALIVEGVIHREYREPSRLLSVFAECGLLVGGVLLILGVALGLTGFLVDAEVPQHAVDWVTASVDSPIIFLLLLNLFLIAVGALIDIYSAIIIVVPLIVPLGAAFGIDPIHLGIIFLTNLELGYLVPPVGENLFIAAYRFDKSIGELALAVLPMVGMLLLAVLAVTYFPALSLWLVERLG